MTTKEKLEALKIKTKMSDRELSELIGISRTTMYKRIREGFSPMESHYIEHLYKTIK